MTYENTCFFNKTLVYEAINGKHYKNTFNAYYIFTLINGSN